jgi:carbonic anhydrase
MPAIDEIVAANARFAAQFDRSALPRPPARPLAVVTCMDARLDPIRFLGLDLGDANVIRNAGGLATDDVIRSLVISHHLLGTREVVVIGHTDCGIVTFTNESLRAKLGEDAAAIDFMPFAHVADAVLGSVERIRASPLLPDSFAATGFVYDVASGRIEPVT